MQEATTPKPPAKSTKRKADSVSNSTNVNVNVSVSVSNTGVVEVQPATPAAKKAKATPKTAAKAAPKTTEKAAPKKAPKAAPKTTAKAAPKTTAKDTEVAPKPKEKSTTAKSTPAVTAPKTKQAPAAKPAKAPAKPKVSTKQTASAPSHEQDEIPPPPYSEYDPKNGFDAPDSQQSSSQPKIGLLNGQYTVSCPHIESNFPEHEGELKLVATLDGKNLWLSFDFGIATGVMKVARPYEVDKDRGTIVLWRGNALERGTDDYYPLVCLDTVARAAPVNTLFFLGDGHLRGILQYGSKAQGTDVKLAFDAYRLFGQSMTSDIRPTEARKKWAQLDERGIVTKDYEMDEEW